jgi:uncharacterized DUF497 family protein
MPFYFFIWDEENERHMSEHGVSPTEFEEVVCDPDFVDASRTTDRPIAFGMTSSGRYLACIYELLDAQTVYAITAYDAEDSDR